MYDYKHMQLRVFVDTVHSAIEIPFPSHRLAKTALRSLAVDEELSTLVHREFSLVAPTGNDAGSEQKNRTDIAEAVSNLQISEEQKSVLHVHYKATTPRMLRVAVNGFFESLGLIIQVMEELDTDVLHAKGIQGLEGVQGIEQGLTGTAIGAGS